MIAANDKIIVEVDYSQKSNVNIAGSSFLLAKSFSNNRRESNPVICKVVGGNKSVPIGAFLVVHHNRFVENSPHHLGGNEYSLAYNSSIFARINEDGSPTALCDNILVEHVYDKENEILPSWLIKPNKFKYKVLQTGFGFKKGQQIFAYEFANYEIIYVWENIEYRIIKIVKSDIVGKLLK